MTSPPTAAAVVSRGVWLAGCVGLLFLVLGVAALGDPTVNSGSDAGGKTATVARLEASGLDGGDLGYWAEDADPAGVHHPFIKTARTDRGWIQATSSLMPLTSTAGAAVAGALGALWVSMLAVPLGALAAARLARDLGAPHGAVAFVVVGAGSPLLFYGTDQWEHAPAVAAGLWALVLLRERGAARRLLWLGAVAGLAVVLRREVGLFLVVAALVELASPDGRSWWRSRWPAAVGGLGVAAIGIVSVQLLDDRVLGTTLGARSGTQLGAAGTDLPQRLRDGLLTTVGLTTSAAPMVLLLGVALLVGVALAAQGWVREDPARVRIGGALVVAALAVRLAAGPGFVPGALVVLPLVGAAPVLAGRRGRPLLVASGAAILLTLVVQWTGSLSAQWGGRYLLVPAAVIAVVAASGIEQRGPRHPAAVIALGSTAVMAGLGLVWHIDRTDEVGATRDHALELADGDVVISTHPHLAREVAVDLLDQRWLLADTIDEVPEAFALVEEAAPHERVWLLHPGACPRRDCERRWEDRADTGGVAGWRSTGVREIPWIGGGTYVLESFAPGGPVPIGRP